MTWRRIVATPAHPEPLVSTQWVAEHLDDPMMRLVEVDLEPEVYTTGHLPGAVLWSVWDDLLLDDERVNDNPAAIGQLLSRAGISPEVTVVLYGDAWNWGATLAFWLIHSAEHRDLRIMDGGRQKWLAEGRQLTATVPSVKAMTYDVSKLRGECRAQLAEVRRAIDSANQTILDVRLPGEYHGELFRPNAGPQDGQLAGHIPGALHVPWETAINEDGTFRSGNEIRTLYEQQGVRPDQEIIPYCTIGGRSSHTWFALTQLAGYPNVRLYDASWAEWGQIPGLPIE
jgi:thiosulfate/3-mercaptopyruvate sulfurtransferase